MMWKSRNAISLGINIRLVQKSSIKNIMEIKVSIEYDIAFENSLNGISIRKFYGDRLVFNEISKKKSTTANMISCTSIYYSVI